MAWDLTFDRSDLSSTTITEVATPEIGARQALLRVDRVGMTANNVTYAVFGDAMRYWDFFPAADLDGKPQGRVPLWGFSVVEASDIAEVPVGTRLYGYLPTSSHLVVEPSKADARGFRDASPHRSHLPAPYNRMTTTAEDPAYDAALEDLQVLYRPLFMTSFMLADFIDDHDRFGADAVVLSSASSKTSYGTAFLLDGIHRIGLTSEANRAFTESLGCYDEVRTYDEVDAIDPVKAVYVDVAGDGVLRRRVHERLETVHSAVVGASHHDAAPDLGTDALPGGAPTFFFAPDQMTKRREDWGPDGVEERHAEAWARFAPVVSGWVDVETSTGPEGLQAAWLETLAGSTSPRQGLVIQP
ncbi:MAG TPA: DUF2855 family protein [Acidimicrobiales bacterium]|nr:DUF2855 family protein [Acidimicrobiales bacterium]